MEAMNGPEPTAIHQDESALMEAIDLLRDWVLWSERGGHTIPASTFFKAKALIRAVDSGKP